MVGVTALHHVHHLTTDAFELLSWELFCACHVMNRKRLSAYLFPPVKVSWAHLIHLWTVSRFHHHHLPHSFIKLRWRLFPSHQRQFVVIHKLRGMVQSSSYLCLRGTYPIIAKNKNQMLPTCIYVTFYAIISCSFLSRVIWLRLFRVGFGWASTVGYECLVWRSRCHLWIYGKEGHLQNLINCLDWEKKYLINFLPFVFSHFVWGL